MTPELKKICEQIEAQAKVSEKQLWKDGIGYAMLPTAGLLALRDYALRVEKMLGAATQVRRLKDGFTVEWSLELHRSGGEPVWMAYGLDTVTKHDTALEAFEATQDVSNGREIQETGAQ